MVLETLTNLQPYLPSFSISVRIASCLYGASVWPQGITNFSPVKIYFNKTSPFCQNPNHTSTQPQPNITLVGLDMKITLHTYHPTTQTKGQQYLSCYGPDLDETLKVGSWEHLEKFPPVMATFVHLRNIWHSPVPGNIFR